MQYTTCLSVYSWAGSKITSPPGYETDCSECGQLRILSELFACIFGERLWGLGQIHPCSLANACFFAQSSRKFGWGSPIPRVGLLSLSFSTPPYPCKRNTSLGNCHRGRRILPVPFWRLLYHCQITPKASISRTHAFLCSSPGTHISGHSAFLCSSPSTRSCLCSFLGTHLSAV